MGCQYRTGRFRRGSRIPVSVAAGVITLLGLPQCLLVNRGTQQPETIVLAAIGLLLLYAGLRLLLARLHRPDTAQTDDAAEAPAWLRFLGGILAGILIFLA